MPCIMSAQCVLSYHMVPLALSGAILDAFLSLQHYLGDWVIWILHMAPVELLLRRLMNCTRLALRKKRLSESQTHKNFL